MLVAGGGFPAAMFGAAQLEASLMYQQQLNGLSKPPVSAADVTRRDRADIAARRERADGSRRERSDVSSSSRRERSDVNSSSRRERRASGSSKQQTRVEAGRDVMKSVRSGGKVALSRYRVLGREGGLSLIEFELLTGRTHQLRVQAATQGWPVLGDETYGNGYDGNRDNRDNRDSRDSRDKALSTPGNTRRPGQLLHARSLGFVHPVTGRSVVVEAPLPDDFEAYARRLRPTGI